MGTAVDKLGLVGSTIEQIAFEACVDSGGFGLVYRGRHLGLDEPVAIKCLRIAGLQSSDADLRETIAGRFRDETKLLYRLSQGHLDIVRCIGSGTIVAPATGEMTPYMILEWLDGTTLGAELRNRIVRAEPPMSLETTVALLESAASALAYAHAQGVVHRDVKPGNLFLAKTRDGLRMKVLDFGLAKILSDDGLGVRPSVETAMGVHFCSPSYGAPEQFSPSVGAVGPWTDVYSLTLVMLEMMLGDQVRQAASLGEGLSLALDPKTGSPTASSLGLRLPKAVEDVLARAVALKPNDRPSDAGVFWGALREAMARGKVDRPKALEATIADANVAAAMEKIRAAEKARAGGDEKAAPKPLPLSGTMVMANAPKNEVAREARPSASPLAASVLAAPGSRPVAPGASTPPPAAAPLPAHGAAAAPPMPAHMPAHMSAPMPAPMQPPGTVPARMPTPMAMPPPMPNAGPVPMGPAPLAARPSGAPGPVRSLPPPPPPKTGSAAVALVLFLLIVMAGTGGAVWWFYLRTR